MTRASAEGSARNAAMRISDERPAGVIAARRDAEDSPDALLVLDVVSADARVIPVGDVDRPVGSDRDVAGTEPVPAVLGRRPGRRRLRLDEHGALEMKSRAVGD